MTPQIADITHGFAIENTTACQPVEHKRKNQGQGIANQ